MNQGYFGQYQGGFKTVPDNAYEMMTAPTKQIAGAISGAVGTLAGSYLKGKEQQAGTEAFQQGAAPQFESIQSLSQAYGVPVNPALVEQYHNMGSMNNPQLQAAFQQSLGQEAQRIQAIGQLNYQRQQAERQYGLQQRGLYNQNQANQILGLPFEGMGNGSNPILPPILQ